jgi:predicted dienelactone hydrolase
VSPGLGSGLDHGAPWCDAWQQAGCWVATLSHPVTNDELWDPRRGPFRDRMAAALAAGQYPARVHDIRFVLDTLFAREDLAASIDMNRIGVAGHSYGALTVQALAGQQGAGQREPRIRAFMALSPSAMTRAVAQRMAAVDSPFLSIVGSHDAHVSFMDGTERIRLGVPLAQRLWIHEQVPPALRALLSVDQADHMTLSGEAVDARRFSRDVPAAAATESEAWQVIARVSTLFWQQAFSFQSARFLADAKPLLRPADRLV